MPVCKTRLRRPKVAPKAAAAFDMPALCAAYKFPSLTPAKPAPIGIVELGGGYKPADIAAAFKAWNLPAPSVTDVSVGGGKNAPGDDADAEVVLDVQVAAAAYSAVTGKPAVVRVYFAPNTDQGFADAVSQAVKDGCATVSISWGAPEDQWGTGTKVFTPATAAARAAGVPVFAASGDNDSGDGEARGAHVDYPASDPNVIGCGGTTKQPASETVWNDGTYGTGGGFSTLFDRPTYQTGLPATPKGRMVPDVAANADPATGYKIHLNGEWTVIGGTSAVAPLYAGLVAAFASTGLPLGDVNSRLWTAARGGFVDVTQGSNGKYKAGTGPDACTGLGVPNGVALFQALTAGTTPPPPPVSPPPPPPPPVAESTCAFSVDLEAKTYFVVVPPGFKAAAAPHFDPAAVNWGGIELDVLRLLLDIKTGNKDAYVDDVKKILADLGLVSVV